MDTVVTQAGSSSKESLQATVFQRLHPRTYLSRFVEEGFRPDGRELGDWRDISVNVGKCVLRSSHPASPQTRFSMHYAPPPSRNL